MKSEPFGSVRDPAYPPPRQDPVYPPHGQVSYSHPPGQGPQTVVVTQPAYVGGLNFHESPSRVRCQFCQADIVTTTFYQTGALTWLACVIIAFVGCWLGCCLIPFLVDACKDVVHKCPNCRRQLGIYKRL